MQQQLNAIITDNNLMRFNGKLFIIFFLQKNTIQIDTPVFYLFELTMTHVWSFYQFPNKSHPR